MTEDDELEEVNTTASAGGEYMTPMAFSGKKKNKKKNLGDKGGKRQIHQTQDHWRRPHARRPNARPDDQVNDPG